MTHPKDAVHSGLHLPKETSMLITAAVAGVFKSNSRGRRVRGGIPPSGTARSRSLPINLEVLRVERNSVPCEKRRG